VLNTQSLKRKIPSERTRTMKLGYYGIALLALGVRVSTAGESRPEQAQVEPARLRGNNDPVVFLPSEREDRVVKPLYSLRKKAATIHPRNKSTIMELERLLDPECPTPSVYFDTNVAFGVDDVSESLTGWMDSSNGTGNFLEEMIALYFDTAVLVGAKGEDIRDLDGDFSEVCNRLPLTDTECYYTQNPDVSFLETLVARFVPFGEEIVKAKDAFDDFMKDVQDTVEDVRNFFLPDAEEIGMCFAITKDMIGIADNPGTFSSKV
jgi:hypothetical protein